VTATARLAEGLLEVGIDGRVTSEAVETLANGLAGALRNGEPFAVLLDRRTMTAPTREGRAALERWAAAELPRLDGRCVAWADLLDPDRFARLLRADERAGAITQENGYPQRTFDDPEAARAWLAEHLRPPFDRPQHQHPDRTEHSR
jgi:hypothetical protein